MRQRGPHPKAKAGGGEVALPTRARLCNALSTRQAVPVALQRSKGSPARQFNGRNCLRWCQFPNSL